MTCKIARERGTILNRLSVTSVPIWTISPQPSWPFGFVRDSSIFDMLMEGANKSVDIVKLGTVFDVEEGLIAVAYCFC